MAKELGYKSIKMYFRHNEHDPKPYKVITKTLAEFITWVEAMKAQGAWVCPNGADSVIVATEKRYIVAGF